MQYEHTEIEKKWQDEWRKRSTYRVENDTAKPKYYVLDMFPYPSGAGLHVGHPLGYIASDIVARYKRHSGFNVLHPMGYDSFGLPAEQYAIQTGQHPVKTTEINLARYREQLDRIGFSFDWSREVRTSDPNYYKWTQWIFLQLFDSWYDPDQDKARPISELIARFEERGCKGQDASVLTGDIEEFMGEFDAAEWKAFDERTKQLVLQYFRLAYLSDAWVNWCPALGTVLANDEVKDGVSERGGHPVERKKMRQWSMRITAYAQRLLDSLDDLDWSTSLKESQRNWIGRSEGATVRFAVGNDFIEVFTTRPDTLFGVSFITLAPEHVLVGKYTTDDRRPEVEAYVKTASNRSERERQAEVDKVSGVFTGSYAKHPFTGADVPIWVGDYVLSGYGTGAVMAVPGGDQRDWRFAKHFGLPIVAVTEGAEIDKEADERKDATICSEGFLKGMKVPEAITRAIQELEKLNAGEGRINFRLRDAAFGRQRYWGEPIPIYYKDGIPYPLPESALPLVLPEVDKFLPTEDGEPPLARAKNWSYEGNPLETTTMPGWAGSSWYFLRYMDPTNEGRFASPEAITYWQQIDLYMGGSEHATGHLLYFRFWTKFLHDRGWLPFDEPAKKLVNQGMIQGVSAKVLSVAAASFETNIKNVPSLYISSRAFTAMNQSGDYSLVKQVLAELNKGFDGVVTEITVTRLYADVRFVGMNDELDTDAFKRDREKNGSELNVRFIAENDGTFICSREVEKMSKSKFNVVNPDDIISKYGADTLRLYEMFLGPLEQSKPWDTNGIEGTFRFLRKFWNLFYESDVFSVSDEAPTKAEFKVLHATLKKVTEDIEKMSFNTSVSQFMIAVNELAALKCHKRDVLEPLTIALAPFAPHIAEELWQQLDHTESITTAPWPKWDAQYLVEDNFSYPISFNGKTRMQLEFPIALSKEEVEAQVLANPEVQQRLEGKAPKKVIVVPKRIVNIVV
ncbi:MAG TPA: class I tRNA ligase family protein [Flavobacteriales bacterium]|jgi:leucyl-tRNA synthetase|nr:leucine--tRNA ligase [Flavobacteriales bacterium]MBK7103553.1 leucine--tRNA ligase [Flavobacteriales bacterium]MBK7113420.1 leucine--tRNA ligase [Flavobacteriales bacterium]MBK8530782.1 leucine--tRNA ligase [Flavobacteriales bacterium]MBK8709976.1 leucine--tRNA ligase [Flavobacteriales bacterium]